MNHKHLQWVEIRRPAMAHNITQFRRLVGAKCKLMAVVKANAYGHGSIEVSRIALEAGAEWLGVNSAEEGIHLRRSGVRAPILILGYVGLRELDEVVGHDLRLIVYNDETVERLAARCRKLGRQARVHIKVETGTHRQGVASQKLLQFIRRIKRHRELILEGLSSHFANIEDTTDHFYPQLQLGLFKSVNRLLRANRISIPIKHMSCTASTILFPQTYHDMVRVGIGLYGLWPSKETYLSCLMQKREPLRLEPVLAWKTRIAQIKHVPKDSLVGYGCTYKTTRDSRLAVVPVGYYDGYARSLSNASYVLIRGRRAALRGRVAMDFLMADITDIRGAGIEDEVTLIGRDGTERITADYLASLAGTINYEIVTRINPNVPRVVVET
ncbi:MAG: alanine racemase [Acidobacteriota bacterium]